MAISYGTYTITEVQEGSQIWTTTVAPKSPNYTFTISNLTGDSETSVKTGDIIMYSYYRYTVLSVSADGTTVLAGNRVSIRGETGASAVTYSLIVSNLAIIKDKNGDISPTSITLTAKFQTGSSAMTNYAGRFKIETTTDNSTWTTQYTSSANESTKDWDVIDDIIAIRCSLYLKDGTNTLLDQQTISVISDGLDGTNGNDAYSIVLTNDNHTFAGNTTSAITSQMECNVIAYKGTTQVAATIGTITGQPTGMTTTLLNNGTTNSAFRVSVSGDMTTRNGTLNIPLTIDGKSFTKEFTYSLALNGEPLFKVELDNYYSAIPVDSDGKTISNCTVEVHFIGRKGENAVATSLVKSSSGGEYPKLFGISPQVINSTTSYNSSMHTTTVISGYIAYTIPKDTIITNDKGNISFKFNLDGASHNLEYNYCWSKVTQGKDGGRWYSGTSITGTSTTATVFSGSGISSAVIGDMYLNTSTYNTYRCTLGGDASTAKWVYVNNIKGIHGDTGKGVSSIVNQYYLSTSNTTQTGGSWSTTVPTYVEDCYYWTKSHIVWTDNTETDTTAVLDNGLTDANANAIDARKVATNYLSVDNTGIMVADMNDGEQTPSTATGRNVFIDNDSVNIRDGQNTLASFTGNNTKFYDIEQNREVASFGTNGVRVGSEDEQHFIVDSESIQAINENGSSIFSVQSTGGTITTEIVVAKGGNSQPHTDWEVYLNGGSSVPQNTFYAKEYSLLIDIDNSINTFDSMRVSVNDGNFQDVPVVRKYYQNTTGMTVYSGHLVTLPPFSFQYGTETVYKYHVEGVYISDKGNTYRYSSTIHIPYDGQRTITMNAVGGTLTQTSGSVSGDNTSIPYGGNSTIWGDIYSSLGYAKAPAMTFGTRGKAGTIAPLSVTIGQSLYANNDNQLSIGRYNLNNDEFSTQLAFAIGNGADDTDRSNAFNVDWDGNVENMGDLEVGKSLIVEGSADNIPNITINKKSTNTTDYIKCQDSDLNAKFRVLGSGGVITAGDVVVGGAETVNGNLYAKGRLLYNSTSTPLFKVVTRTIDNISIGVNTGAYPSVAVNESGYTPIAITGIKLEKASNNGTTYGWCIVQYFTINGQTLNFYVGNWSTSSAAKIKMEIKVLCIRTSAL